MQIIIFEVKINALWRNYYCKITLMFYFKIFLKLEVKIIHLVLKLKLFSEAYNYKYKIYSCILFQSSSVNIICKNVSKSYKIV